MLTAIVLVCLGVIVTTVAVLLTPTTAKTETEVLNLQEIHEADEVQASTDHERTLLPRSDRLVITDVKQIRDELETKKTFRAGRLVRRRISQAQGTTSVVRAETELMEAQGEQAQSFLRNKNEIEALQDEAELRPLRKQEKVSAIAARVAANEFQEAELRKRNQNLQQPALPPETKAREDPRAIMKRRFQSRVALKTDHLNVYNELLAEAREKHKDEPDTLRVIEDALENQYTEEIKRK